MPDQDDTADHLLDQVFAALADPTRRRLVTALLEGDRTVGDLARPFPMSLAAVSRHLQVLVRAGLVSQVRQGRERACRLEPDGLAAAAVWIQGCGAFDGADVAGLERLLEDLLEPSSDRSLLAAEDTPGTTSRVEPDRGPT